MLVEGRGPPDSSWERGAGGRMEEANEGVVEGRTMVSQTQL